MSFEQVLSCANKILSRSNNILSRRNKLKNKTRMSLPGFRRCRCKNKDKYWIYETTYYSAPDKKG